MTTQRFAVIGDPVNQSASPRMHGAAYAALGLDCTYEAIHTVARDVDRVVARLRSGELAGVNVTVPHKQRVLAFVDDVAATAAAARAANTLVRSEGRVVAHNTDVAALAQELTSLLSEVEPRRGIAPWGDVHALVLGTGATARSAVVALACTLGVARITVRGRALANAGAAAALEAELTPLLGRDGRRSSLSLEPGGAVAETEREVTLVVQATSLGMRGGDAGELARDAVDWSSLSPRTIALDVVYASGVTPFVAAARARGLRAADGRGMLARQGALAFELWLRRPAPIDVMRAALAG